MENIGAKTGYGVAYRLGEGAMVAPVIWLPGADDSDSVFSCEDQPCNSSLTSPNLEQMKAL